MSPEIENLQVGYVGVDVEEPYLAKKVLETAGFSGFGVEVLTKVDKVLKRFGFVFENGELKNLYGVELEKIKTFDDTDGIYLCLTFAGPAEFMYQVLLLETDLPLSYGGYGGNGDVIYVEVMILLEDKFKKLVEESKLPTSEKKKVLSLYKQKFDGVAIENLTPAQLELFQKVAPIEVPPEVDLKNLLEAKEWGRKIRFNVVFEGEEEPIFWLGAIVLSKRILREPEGPQFVGSFVSKLLENSKVGEDGEFKLTPPWILWLEETPSVFNLEFDQVEGGLDGP